MGCCSSQENRSGVVIMEVAPSQKTTKNQNNHRHRLHHHPGDSSTSNYSASFNEDNTERSLYTKEKDQLGLYEAIYNRRWDEAETLLLLNKKEGGSHYIDTSGRMPIHWACFKNAPPALVQKLVKLDSESALFQDKYGKTPLHIACEFSSQETIGALLEASPWAVSAKDEEGKTPLVEAILNERSPNIIQQIIKVDPTQIWILDKNGNIPMLIFFRRHLNKLVSYLQNERPFSGLSKRNIFHDDGVESLYAIAELLLRTEYETTTTTTTTTTTEDAAVLSTNIVLGQSENRKHWDFLLHAAIQSSNVPFDFVELVLRQNPEQIRIRNDQGDLPLHVAAALSSHRSLFSGSTGALHQDAHQEDDEGVRESLSQLGEVSETPVSKRKPPQEKSLATIQKLLSLAPETASAKNNIGRNALITAIASGKTWDMGIGELYNASPPSTLLEMDASRLLPFMMAALPPGSHQNKPNDVSSSSARFDVDTHDILDDNEGQLSTIYQLLRAEPKAIQIAIETLVSEENDGAHEDEPLPPPLEENNDGGVNEPPPPSPDEENSVEGNSVDVNEPPPPPPLEENIPVENSTTMGESESLGENGEDVMAVTVEIVSESDHAINGQIASVVVDAESTIVEGVTDDNNDDGRRTSAAEF